MFGLELLETGFVENLPPEVYAIAIAWYVRGILMGAGGALILSRLIRWLREPADSEIH